jgi:hypothetical protein
MQMMGAVGLRILSSFTFGNFVKFAYIVLLQLGVLTLIDVGWCVVNRNTPGGVDSLTLGVAINFTSPTVIPLVSFRPSKQQMKVPIYFPCLSPHVTVTKIIFKCCARSCWLRLQITARTAGSKIFVFAVVGSRTTVNSPVHNLCGQRK